MNEDRKAQEHDATEEKDEQSREEQVDDLDVPEEQSGDVKGGAEQFLKFDPR